MSGKRAKKLRKNQKVPKKLLAVSVLGVCLSSAPAISEGNVLLSLYPHYTLPLISFSSSMDNGVGAGVKLTYRPVPYFDVFLNGDYQNFGFKTADQVENLTVLNGGLGAGYHIPITDRVGMNLNAEVGYYNAKYGAQKSVSGLNVGASINFSYKITPVISTEVNVSGVHYMAGSSALLTGVQLSPGITLNLTKAFKNTANISMDMVKLDPVFPVLYSWYDQNSFGSIRIENKEDAAITDVKVYFYQPQYMGHPNECGSAKKLNQGEALEVDLTAFFNEQMLELIEKNDTQADIIVEYKYLGQKKQTSFVMTVPVYGRNNMSWSDDRCASVFVSSKDPAAMWFAKYITSIVRDNVRSGVAPNIQYAMGIFEALDQFGLNYVIDPTSAFADNVGSASIDFLQFPYQTLMYRGGDCDDLSILVCSLFEAIGIDTAFITIPGHIFMAFDSGLTLEQAKQQFNNLDELIIDGNEVWVPLEITLTDEGFNKAWRVGAREWNQAQTVNAAALYKMKDSWKIYKPVSVPGAQARFSLPDEKIVGKLFSHSVDEYIVRQIQPQITYYEAKIARNKSPENFNDFGVLYARYGLFANAENQFKSARKVEFLPAIINTANLYYSMKDFSRAQKWYEEVLKKDSDNIYAMLGIARCTYETGEYNLCDDYYKQVYEKDVKLAKQFAYLGSFEESNGRSFTLADRLSNTIWLDSTYNNEKIKEEASITEKESLDEVVLEVTPVKEEIELPDFMLDGLFLVPDAEIKEKEEEETAPADATAGGDDGDGEETEETYKGILSQIEFDLMSLEELAEAAAEVPVVVDLELPAYSEENTFEIEEIFVEEPEEEEVPEEEPEVQEIVWTDAWAKKPAQPKDIKDREVPRFTKQPSEEWAPAEAYVVQVIPGMRSFEEEMGDYTNEKAFLYQDEFAFAVNPEEDDGEDFVIDASKSELLAMSSIPDVNPFSSYLSEADAKAVEEITKYSVKENKQEEEKSVISVAEIEPVKEVEIELPASAAFIVEEAPVVEQFEIANIEEKDNKKENKKGLLPIIIAGTAAIIGAIFGITMKKSKKREEGRD